MQSVCQIFAGFAEEEERSALAELIQEVLYEDSDSHRKLVVLHDNARRRALLNLIEKQSELYSESA